MNEKESELEYQRVVYTNSFIIRDAIRNIINTKKINWKYGIGLHYMATQNGDLYALGGGMGIIRVEIGVKKHFLGYISTVGFEQNGKAHRNPYLLRLINDSVDKALKGLDKA